MVKATNFSAGMGWQQLRGCDRHPTTGFSVQDVRKLDEVEPFDLTVVTSVMLEKEGLWKRGTESAILGEGSASWETEGSFLLFVIRIVA